MWGVALTFFSYVAAQVTAQEIEMECRRYTGFPPNNHTSPSFLADLKVEKVKVEGNYMLNISWAVSIDASIGSLTGTRIGINGEYSHCKYNPPLAKANLSGSQQKWFHYSVKASYGFTIIQVANLPLPQLGSERSYKVTSITVSRPQKPVSTTKPSQLSTVEITTLGVTDVTQNDNSIIAMGAIFGGLVGLMILSSCYIFYKSCGTKFALGFKKLPTSPTGPVPVLVVYPAENAAFQRAVVALAEFLQWHGGCNVAVDMWQQGKIAELGPMRWLAEQAKAVDQVLIVCPQSSQLSSRPIHCPPNNSLPAPSIPAAAHDLYPLILNMVASHTKSTSDLARFMVVQLGKQHDKTASNLPLELRACKRFCLMKDLDKLCRSLHSHRQDHKTISDLILRPGIAYSEKRTVQLREAVENLCGQQPQIFRKVEPLKSMVTST